jgi:hypothetical protein
MSRYYSRPLTLSTKIKIQDHKPQILGKAEQIWGPMPNSTWVNPFSSLHKALISGKQDSGPLRVWNEGLC